MTWWCRYRNRSKTPLPWGTSSFPFQSSHSRGFRSSGQGGLHLGRTSVDTVRLFHIFLPYHPLQQERSSAYTCYSRWRRRGRSGRDTPTPVPRVTTEVLEDLGSGVHSPCGSSLGVGERREVTDWSPFVCIKSFSFPKDSTRVARRSFRTY